MMFLPRALAATSAAQNALARLTPLFHAELRTDVALNIDPEQKSALHVEDATFEWEEVLEDNVSKFNEKDRAASDPFQVQRINMSIPYGQLIAVVGKVGSGKVQWSMSC
jgi:ABC-type siderophore export system fused ATPase/permease subunit